MTIGVTADYAVIVCGVGGGAMAMLRAIPFAVRSSGRRPWEADPVSGPDDDDAARVREDWEEVVAPELRFLCDTQIDTVLEDLGNATPAKEASLDYDESGFPVKSSHGCDIRIEPDRVEAWYGALNQARLALDACHGFAKADPDPDEIESWPNAKQGAFWQFRLFAALQEALLFSMENQFGESGSA